MLSHLAVAFLACTQVAFAAPEKKEPYSLWFAKSLLTKGQKVNNHYVSSVIHEGLYKAAVHNKDAKILQYVSDAISSIVTPAGKVVGFNYSFNTLDDFRAGNNILYFWNSEGRNETKLQKAALSLRRHFDTYPRTKSGGYWHRDPIYTNQLWLDGIYMAQTFYATYTSYFEPQNITAWNDIVLQFDLVEKYTRNKTSNLLAHGYDEGKKAVWAHPVTGSAPLVWDRALGWYFMALVDVLQVYPKDLPGYQRLRTYFNQVADGVKRAQDKSGGWWLIMNEPYPSRRGNYIESSATAMFVYGYLKGIRTGLLPASYLPVATKGYQLLIDKFIIHEKNGTLSMNGTVEVGSLNSNASFEYYTSVPIELNDGKGTGPFLYASVEYEQLKKLNADSD